MNPMVVELDRILATVVPVYIATRISGESAGKI
jgi:hypothetical protein